MVQSVPLALRIARELNGLRAGELDARATAKARLCLLDLIGCAFEARDMPWSRQARGLAARADGQATVIGAARPASPTEAAFANGVMGHGLVREDMHAGAISHLGMVVLPTVLALSETRPVRGAELLAAIVAGYEAGARIGRALIDSELARVFRPTGITGPTGAAAAGARLLGLGEEQAASAIALAANSIVGLNQWAHTGGSEMYFHAGFVARNAVSGVLLAQDGAFASPSVLDGEAGLFAALRKPGARDQVTLFDGEPEILNVYHKALPACNFAQTASQAALAITAGRRVEPGQIESIVVRVPRAAAAYPGCDMTGPFAHVLQAKMSIQYNVAAALMLGAVTEANFELLRDATLHRLLARTRLEVDEGMTSAYPARQGAEVLVQETGGTLSATRLDDVVHASEHDVRQRFRAAATRVVGDTRAKHIESMIDGMEREADAGQLGSLLRAPAAAAEVA